MAAIRGEAETNNGQVWMHFEAHGSEAGIQLWPSLELVEWHEMTSDLIEVNLRTKNRLVVTMGTCFGHHFWRTMDLRRRAPFAYYIGPKGTISADRAYSVFYSFYSELVLSGDFNLAFERSGVGEESFGALLAHQMIMIHVQLVLEDLDPFRIAKFLSDGHRKHGESRPWPRTRHEYAELRQQYVERLIGSTVEFYQRYLFIDEHPEISTRYNLVNKQLFHLLEARRITERDLVAWELITSSR